MEKEKLLLLTLKRPAPLARSPAAKDILGRWKGGRGKGWGGGVVLVGRERKARVETERKKGEERPQRPMRGGEKETSSSFG